MREHLGDKASPHTTTYPTKGQIEPKGERTEGGGGGGGGGRIEVERGNLKPERRGELPHWGRQFWLWLWGVWLWLYGGAWSSDLCIPHSTPHLIRARGNLLRTSYLRSTPHSVHPTTQLEAIYRACPPRAIPAYTPNGVVCIP